MKEGEKWIEMNKDMWGKKEGEGKKGKKYELYKGNARINEAVKAKNVESREVSGID